MPHTSKYPTEDVSPDSWSNAWDRGSVLVDELRREATCCQSAAIRDVSDQLNIARHR